MKPVPKGPLDLVGKLGLELYAQHHIGGMGESEED